MPPVPARERVRAHRARKRQQGLKPVTIWAYDLDDPEVRAELERECREIAKAEEGEREILAWLESVNDWPSSEEDIPEYMLPDNRQE